MLRRDSKEDGEVVYSLRLMQCDLAELRMTEADLVRRRREFGDTNLAGLGSGSNLDRVKACFRINFTSSSTNQQYRIKFASLG